MTLPKNVIWNGRQDIAHVDTALVGATSFIKQEDVAKRKNETMSCPQTNLMDAMPINKDIELFRVSVLSTCHKEQIILFVSNTSIGPPPTISYNSKDFLNGLDHSRVRFSLVITFKYFQLGSHKGPKDGGNLVSLGAQS